MGEHGFDGHGVDGHGVDEHGVDEQGSVIVWMVLVVGVCALVLVLLGHAAGEAGRSARVQTTADLAALAGVDGGRTAAVRVAKGNGAELRSFAISDETVTVAVTDDGLTATATAEPDAAPNDPPDDPPDHRDPQGAS